MVKVELEGLQGSMCRSVGGNSREKMPGTLSKKPAGSQMSWKGGGGGRLRGVYSRAYVCTTQLQLDRDMRTMPTP